MERSILWSLLFCLQFSVSAQQFDWAKSIGGLGTDVARDLTVDQDGNVIVVGSFSGSANVDGTWMSGDGVLEAFVAKFTANGDLLWTRVITGPGEDMARGVVTEDDGTIYVVGHFTDTVTFNISQTDTAAVKGKGGKDLFIAKYSADGEFIWYITGGGDEDDTATDIDRYPWSGKLYVSGGFQDRGVFGTAQALSSGRTDALLLKIDADGNVHWAKSGGGPEHDVASAVTVDQTNESIFIAGDFYLEAEFGETQLQSVGSSDMFLARYDEDGNQIWVQSNGGTNVDVATDIGVDLNNMVYVCGYYQLTTHFQSHSQTALGYNDVFLAQFNPDGNCNWLSSAGSNALDNCLGMDVAWDGTTYMCGMFEDEMFAGNLSVPGTGYDVFVLKHDPNGQPQYIKTAGSTSSDFGMAACLAPDKSLFISGYYFYYADFDDVTIGNAENGDAFVARLTGIVGMEDAEDLDGSCFQFDPQSNSIISLCELEGNWTLINALGQVVDSGVLETHETINISGTGVFLLVIDSDAGIFTKKVFSVSE
ncbi:MAG: hypothetical protein H6603_01410 [Flavobacteriales bacterium]|nr:hypothetical protein [Flavobacteriales bacterium]MCB9203608.1 hypothetical protein [Flavobacteriales bacterium]